MKQEITMPIPRPEHPRPDFMRETFYNLNGQWQFGFDDRDVGVQQGWFQPGHKLETQITVPFCYQSKASGIGPTDEIHPIMWYRRSFTVPQQMEGKRILLRFGAVDHTATVYVNGNVAGSHRGGYTPFALDVTDFLCEGENDLCVRVEDWPELTQPRGKQYWKPGVEACLYVPSSGIWQTVYIEAVEKLYADYIHITPDIDRGLANVQIVLNRIPDTELTLQLTVSKDGEKIRQVTTTTNTRQTSVSIDMDTRDKFYPIETWSPKNPRLYDLRLQISAGNRQLDQVDTYFGMRKIEVHDGVIYLNNSRIYQRLVLDQGYWPDTMITPPSDEAIREDLQWTLKLGFNGARKHQKIEDPRYYYWADKMGVLVWGEMPSAFAYSDQTVEQLSATMTEFIRRDYNHPCIITWVPLNESWGVPQIVANRQQMAAASALYYLSKALDGTRLCSGNDGWEQAHTDICGLHDYHSTKQILKDHFGDREFVEKQTCDGRRAYADGYSCTGEEAFMVTEYGGIAFENIGIQGKVGGMETWGYHGKVTDVEEFFHRYQQCTQAILEIPYCRGYCYTQLTDVMQEINGLLTPDRKPKMDPERVRELTRDPV